MESPILLNQVEELKINVKNIHKFLVGSNKNLISLKNKNKEIKRRKLEINRQNLKQERIQFKSPFTSLVKGAANSVATSPLNIFDKILGAGSLILAGILVNNLPGIIDKVRSIIDSIVDFVTPIRSGFNLLKAFFEKDLQNEKYEKDKKIVDGKLDEIREQLDKMDGEFDIFKPLLDIIGQFSGIEKNFVLAKKDGKEGFIDGAGKFYEQEFTLEERKRFNKERAKQESKLKNEMEKKVEETTTQQPTTQKPTQSSSFDPSVTGNMISGFPITSRYKQQESFRTRPHGGVDIGTPQNTPISFKERGKILYALKKHGAYGHLMDVWLPKSSIQMRLAHLSTISKSSGSFEKDETIAYTGGAKGHPGSGRSTGPHLHIEVDTVKGSARYGGDTDPMKFAGLLNLGGSTSKSQENLISLNKRNTPTSTIIAFQTVRESEVQIITETRSEIINTTSSNEISKIWGVIT